MNRYTDRAATPLAYHHFLWYFSLPVGILLSLLQLTATGLLAQEANAGSAIDILYCFGNLALSITAFVGFCKWSAMGWYGILALQLWGMGYRAVLALLYLVLAPLQIASAVGSFFASGAFTVLIFIYYQKRKPLFFPAEAAAILEAQSAPAGAARDTIYCNKCGSSNLLDYNFCAKCGAPLYKGEPPEAQPGGTTL